jgi:cyclopropane-fatty-acyl-phospholipid synthase
VISTQHATDHGAERLIDPSRWPDVAAVPGSAPRAEIARLLFHAAVGRLPIRVRLSGGRQFGGGGTDAPLMAVHDPGAFFARLGAGGLIGFGESYMAGEWDCADLTRLLTVFASNVSDLVPTPLQRLRRLAVRRQPSADEQTKAGARRNIGRHYDLSNEFFALFLDETMTYSSALFETTVDEAPNPADRLLGRAQRRKIDRLLDQARVGPGSRLLEIGTGWGQLAIQAAERGAIVRTVTISSRQHELAARRVAEAGLADRISVELRDYRDVSGHYDAICSVEMIEAVGDRYWDTYFAQLDQLLAPGGRVALQSITMPHDRMMASRRTYTWILKYIFPGGLIPSVTAIEDSLRRRTRLRVTDQHDFGPHYAQTLQLWRDRFNASRDEVLTLGFDDVFLRMWEFYLCYAEAGFLAGYLNVSQLTLERA